MSYYLFSCYGWFSGSSLVYLWCFAVSQVIVWVLFSCFSLRGVFFIHYSKLPEHWSVHWWVAPCIRTYLPLTLSSSDFRDPDWSSPVVHTVKHPLWLQYSLQFFANHSISFKQFKNLKRPTSFSMYTSGSFMCLFTLWIYDTFKRLVGLDNI